MQQKRFMKNNFHHVYSRGVNVLFYDEKDYIFFNNRLAVTAHTFNVELLAFAIMSTHFHAVVYTWSDDAMQQFISMLRKTYAIYFRLRYGHSIPNSEFEISYTDNEKYNFFEFRKQRMLYVLKNSMKHQACESPLMYEFGTAHYMLLEKVLLENEKSLLLSTTKKISEMSPRSLNRLFGTENLPQNWTCTSDGMLLPSSFVNISKCMSEYFGNRTKSFIYDMNSAMTNDSNEIVGDDQLMLQISKYNDLQVSKMIMDYAAECGVKSHFFLSPQDKIYLQNRLKNKFVLPDQIQRCLWLEKPQE